MEDAPGKMPTWPHGYTLPVHLLIHWMQLFLQPHRKCPPNWIPWYWVWNERWFSATSGACCCLLSGVPKEPARLQGSQLVSHITYLAYRPTHSSDGNSGQCQLGGNLVPRPIILLLGILRGCWDCRGWGWGNSQIRSLCWPNCTSCVSSTSVLMPSLPFCTENLA